MELSGATGLGVLAALVGAVLLAFGAQLQHRGVSDLHAADPASRRGAVGGGQLARLLRSRRWVAGVGVTGAAILLNLVGLRLAPLVVVQPLGVLALVVTALLGQAAHSYRLRAPSILGMALSVVGVAAFVTTGTLTARNAVVSDVDLTAVVVALAVVAALLAVAVPLLRPRWPATVNVLAAGVLAGFAVTLAKAVVTRISVGRLDLGTLIGAVLLVALVAGNQWFMQSAYASGPVDLIVAGLTIADPLVAVTIGVVLLGEAARTPPIAAAAYAASAVVAVVGVVLLARHHPLSAAETR